LLRRNRRRRSCAFLGLTPRNRSHLQPTPVRPPPFGERQVHWDFEKLLQDLKTGKSKIREKRPIHIL
jgi:hypothetical protein